MTTIPNPTGAAWLKGVTKFPVDEEAAHLQLTEADVAHGGVPSRGDVVGLVQDEAITWWKVAGETEGPDGATPGSRWLAVARTSAGPEPVEIAPTRLRRLPDGVTNIITEELGPEDL